MKKAITFILYVTIFFAIVFGGTGTLRIGPLSLRHICTLTLFLYICFGGKRISDYSIRKVFRYYMVYLTIYTLANTFNGEILSHHFIQSLFTYHLPCLGILLSFPRMIRDKKQLSLVTYAIIAVYLVNAVLTVFQYNGDPVAWETGRMIAEIKDDHQEAIDAIAEKSDNLFGYSIASGIIGFVVTNGYIIATFSPLLLIHFFTKRRLLWIVDILLAALAVYASFATQQRTAFFLVLLYMAFLLALRSNLFIKTVVLCSFLYLLANGSQFFDTESLGRIQEVETGLGNREDQVDGFVNFLCSPYMIFGGSNAYEVNFGMAQHNSLLSAWVLGGIFTFICFAVFYFYLVKKVIMEFFVSLKKTSYHSYTIAYSAASGIFLFYSLFHSAGVQNGSPMFWIAFTLLLISVNIEKKSNYA